MSTRLTMIAVLAATTLLAGRAHAVTQPPHDLAGGTECVRCHIPYGGVNDSAQATGTAAAGSGTTILVDTAKAWTVGMWTGGVVTFTSGANLGQYRTITASGTSSMSWPDPLPAVLASGDTYKIGKTTYDDVEAKCRSCHSATGPASTMPNVGLHVVNGGTTVIGCGKCHEPHNVEANTGRGNGLLRLAVRWPTATIPISYPASPGNRFIATSAPYNGICQVCHTQTKHHRNDGTGADHYPSTACTDCHQHQNRFAHGAGGTGCIDCHGHDPGFPLGGGKVSLGAASFQSHSTHTENDSDDRRGPNLACDACHDSNAFPYFKSGTDVNGDGKITLAETDVCEDCHSSSGSYDGINDANFGAKHNWSQGIYNGDNATLRPGKERWCAGCHDEAPSSVGGVLAPWVAGEEGVPTDWGTTGYGFYKTGHGLPSGAVYPWTLKTGSTQQRSGAGLGCEACHDTAAIHVDGVTRSYTLSPNPVGYQAGYRLKSVAGSAPMQMPRVYQGTDPAVKPEDFPLCLSCHDAKPFTSASAKATNYRDDVAGRNDHNFHLTLQDKVFRSDWAQDASVSDSRPTCVTCHNVHGSTQIAMINDGLLTSRGVNLTYSNVGSGSPPVGLSLADSNHTAWHMYQTQYSSSNPSGLCAQSCHYNTDPSVWSFYTRLPYDNLVPRITATYGVAASNLVSLRFSKPVYGPAGGALLPADLALVDAGGRTIAAVDHVAGGDLAILTLSAPLGSGLGIDTVAPAAGIYDLLGNRMPSTPVVIGGSDGTAPVMVISSPANGAVDVPATTSLSFNLSDAASGVIWSSVTVSLSGNLGYSASYTSTSPQLSKTGAASSYAVALTPAVNFGLNETITVAASATDLMGNALVPVTWTFSTAAAATPATTRLHPSGAYFADGWSTSPLNQWATVLDVNDTTNYAQGSGSATTFYVDLDNPPSFGGAVQSIQVTAIIQTTSSTGISFTLGWRVGAAGATQSASVMVSSADGWASKTINLPVGASLNYSDIVNLQAFVGRITTGTHTDRVTELHVDVTYLP
jgi:hypothetical protein